MDASAVFGLIGALTGSVVGSAGTYWATVGGARAQSRARVRAACSAIRARLSEEQQEAPTQAERLTTLAEQLQSILTALGAARRGEPARLDGTAHAADAPGGRRWLRSHTDSALLRTLHKQRSGYSMPQNPYLVPTPSGRVNQCLRH